jgi:hypothetical protein
MAGILTSTLVQVQAARDSTFKLARALQQIVDGTVVGPAQQNPAQVTQINALIAANVAAVNLLNL